MWLPRSFIVWFYALLVMTSARTCNGFAHVVCFGIHMLLLYILTKPFLARKDALAVLRHRFLVAAVWGIFLVTVPSTLVMLTASIVAVVRSDYLAIVRDMVSDIGKMADLGKMADPGKLAVPDNGTEAMTEATKKLTDSIETLYGPGTPFAVFIEFVLNPVVFTVAALSLTSGYLALATQVVGHRVEVGVPRVDDVLTFALVGALGLSTGHLLLELMMALVFIGTAMKMDCPEWWKVILVAPLTKSVQIAGILISAVRLALSVASSRIIGKRSSVMRGFVVTLFVNIFAMNLDSVSKEISRKLFNNSTHGQIMALVIAPLFVVLVARSYWRWYSQLLDLEKHRVSRSDTDDLGCENDTRMHLIE